MMIVLASLSAGALIFLLCYFLIVVRVAPKTEVHQRLKKMNYNTSDQEQEQSLNLADIPFVERTIIPLSRAVERRLLRLAPAGMHELISHKLILAGKQYQWGVNAFVSGWVLSVICMFLLAFMMISSHSYAFIQRLAILVLGIFFGGALPFVLLNSLIQQRQKKILRQLPEVLDLLCVSVQAGLSFDGSLLKIVERMKGPFIEEADRMLRDVRMGMTRKAALLNMAKRCDIQEVHLFVTAVVQAEQLGTSMGQTLMNQADNMRERRRQKAKAEALKAPVKIVFPLVLFIFPALFVVVLVPTLLTLFKSFTHM